MSEARAIAVGWRTRLARALECGVDLRGPFGRALARGCAHAWAAGLARPLRVPDGVRAVGVGGATLGGSGKTGLSIALCRALAGRGAKVALVGHAYRAFPGGARRVGVCDALGEVGDEALVAARALAPHGVPVIVGPTRQAALDEAARSAEVVVLDGVLQARPKTLSLSLLVLDGARPFASAQVPPFGDLRALPHDLLRTADWLVVVDGERIPGGQEGAAVRAPLASCGGLDLPADRVVRVSRRLSQGTDREGRSFSLEHLQGERTGLLLGIAHPERLLRALAVHGIRPLALLDFGDHAAASRALLRHAERVRAAAGVHVWLATAKCCTRLPEVVAGAPVLALEDAWDIAPLVCRWSRG